MRHCYYIASECNDMGVAGIACMRQCQKRLDDVEAKVAVEEAASAE